MGDYRMDRVEKNQGKGYNRRISSPALQLTRLYLLVCALDEHKSAICCPSLTNVSPTSDLASSLLQPAQIIALIRSWQSCACPTEPARPTSARALDDEAGEAMGSTTIVPCRMSPHRSFFNFSTDAARFRDVIGSE